MQSHIRQRMADVGHLRFYFQDSKFEGVFPHLGEKSMSSGIRWLGEIRENYRLTRCKRAISRRKNLKQNQGWYRPDLKGHGFTGCGPSLRA
jgi:phage terminase large subunit